MTTSSSRVFLATIAAVGMALLGAVTAAAAPQHGLSAFGELKYPADFKHFDWVNPDAPKGGRFSTNGGKTFDTFNGFILKGDAAQGLGLQFDSLMAAAGDEPDSVYALVARDADVAADRMSVTFRMRPEARFADGSALTADDVVFSFDTLKTKGHPAYRFQLEGVAKAEALDPHTVRYIFQGNLVRDLPMVVAALPILSKAYYTAKDFTVTTLEPPLGSGPYKIADFKAGTFITYKRREDYWGKDLPVNRGRYNFDEIRFEYYRDRTAELLSLKGGNFDFREEFTSRDWATAYDIQAVKEGRLKLDTLPDKSPSGAQGFFINTRRAKFQDIRVRQALDLAFDFEFTNKNLFFAHYKRSVSFFENSDMKAVGKPTPEELALLEPFKADLPKEVYGDAYVPPISDGSGSDRKLLGEAHRLLVAAGYTLAGGKRVDAKGAQFEIEFMSSDATSERLLGPYVKNLNALGINATIRTIDAAQYERRVKSFDFDIMIQRFVMSLVPGVELKNYFASATAEVEGSRNLAGIRSKVIDTLIEKVTAARSRAELIAATRAMDRVVRAGHYWVPHWYKASHTIAYWDKFSRPAKKPDFARGVIDSWWYDAVKAAKLQK